MLPLHKFRISPIALCTLLALLVLGAAAGAGAQGDPQPTTLGTAFSYQGSLSLAGKPVDGPTDFQFILYDAPVGGAQIGTKIVKLDRVPVANGLFNVGLDFGAVFNATPAYLEVGVRPGGSGEPYTIFSPRTPLLAAPQALFSATTAGLQGRSVSRTAPNTGQVLLWNGAEWAAADDPSPTYSAGAGLDLSNGQFSVTTPLVLKGISSGGLVYASNSAGGHAIYGSLSGGYGYSEYSSGVWGDSGGDSYTYGVVGSSKTIDSAGVLGDSLNGYGVKAYSKTGYGLYADTGSGSYAAYLAGNVRVTGMLTKAGGAFKIDHPLDPANKYLSHSFVESPDMKNIYDGVATLDAAGSAVVTLPNWFEALNQDFRYQLTAVGAPAPGLYIAQKIAGNRFAIAGGAPGAEVSWQVTGIRHDAWAKAHRIPVEEDKPGKERGTYLHPDELGQPASLGVDYAQRRLMERAASSADSR